MKTKVGTVIDEVLLRRAKVVAAANGMALSKVLEDALREYLDRRRGPRVDSAVASTWGVMQADAPLVQSIMEEEGILEA
jgi:hypothetical protein